MLFGFMVKRPTFCTNGMMRLHCSVLVLYNGFYDVFMAFSFKGYWLRIIMVESFSRA
jgi:uncharacterized membrane protein YiaA